MPRTISVLAALSVLAPTCIGARAHAADPLLFIKGDLLYTVSTTYTAPIGSGVSQVAMPASFRQFYSTKLVEPDGSYVLLSSDTGVITLRPASESSEKIFSAPDTAYSGTVLRSYYNRQFTMSGVDANGKHEQMRFASFIWGGVHGLESISFGTSNDVGTTINGADVLAAAAAQGFAEGNHGSFYVSVAAAPGAAAFGVIRMAGSGKSSGTDDSHLWFTTVPLAFSTQEVDLREVAVASPAGEPIATQPAPAPVLGGTQSGSLACLLAWGLFGCARKRRRAAAA